MTSDLRPPTSDAALTSDLRPPTSDKNEVLVRVEGVKKKFCRSLKKSLWYGVKDMATEVVGGKGKHDTLRAGEFWAINDVSFELRRGECLGLIGRNGAGKTTLLKMLNGLIKPDHGRIEMRGRVGALIALGAGFNPILSGRENIYVNGSVLGLNKREIDEKIEHIIDYAEIREFIDAPVQSYSSGMQVRLGFSVAVNLIQPDVLILDEVLAVGDAAFRAKCELSVGKLINTSAVIFVSHTALHIRRLCNKVLWLEQGKPKGFGLTDNLLNEYEREAVDKRPIQANQVLNNQIKSVKVVTFVPPKRHGASMTFEVEVCSDEPVLVQQVVVGIVEGESNLVAQSNMKSSLTINGTTIIRIETDPLQLRDGRYAVNFVLYGENYRDLILRFNALQSFELKSGVVGGANYHFKLYAESGKLIEAAGELGSTAP
jgi:lipopolysaccharide transport system ATP-binding protein